MFAGNFEGALCARIIENQQDFHMYILGRKTEGHNSFLVTHLAFYLKGNQASFIFAFLSGQQNFSTEATLTVPGLRRQY